MASNMEKELTDNRMAWRNAATGRMERDSDGSMAHLIDPAFSDLLIKLC